MKKIFVMLFLLSLILAASLALVGYLSLGEKKIESTGTAKIIVKTLGKATEQTVKADGSTVLEILEKNYDIKIYKTAFSVSIECINNVCAKQDFWWKFLVNGEKILDSTGHYVPKNGDIITIEYGDVK